MNANACETIIKVCFFGFLCACVASWAGCTVLMHKADKESKAPCKCAVEK